MSNLDPQGHDATNPDVRASQIPSANGSNSRHAPNNSTLASTPGSASARSVTGLSATGTSTHNAHQLPSHLIPSLNPPHNVYGQIPQQYRYYNDQYQYYNQQGNYPPYMYNQQNNYPYNYYQGQQNPSPQQGQAVTQNQTAISGQVPPGQAQMVQNQQQVPQNQLSQTQLSQNQLSQTQQPQTQSQLQQPQAQLAQSQPQPQNQMQRQSQPNGMHALPQPTNNQPVASQPSENMSTSSTVGQFQPPGIRPRVTTTMWEDEKTLCYQVDANNVSVVRRADNNMINGTKLLNVAQMTRGRRDGILKLEKVRHVVKIGSMHLKGVWIPFERALAMAQREGIVDLLYPLFVRDIKRVIQTGISPNKQAGFYQENQQLTPQQHQSPLVQQQPIPAQNLQQQQQPQVNYAPQAERQQAPQQSQLQPPVYGYQQYYPTASQYYPYNGYNYNNQVYPPYQYLVKPKEEKDDKKE